MNEDMTEIAISCTTGHHNDIGVSIVGSHPSIWVAMPGEEFTNAEFSYSYVFKWLFVILYNSKKSVMGQYHLITWF